MLPKKEILFQNQQQQQYASTLHMTQFFQELYLLAHHVLSDVSTPEY